MSTTDTNTTTITDNTTGNIKDDIKKELERLQVVKGNDNWKSARETSLFTKGTINTPTGKRVAYMPSGLLHNKNLQASRGVSVENNTKAEDLMPEYEDGMCLTSIDKLRINEVDIIFDQLRREIKGGNLNPKLDEIIKYKGMCEFGFRWPRLMKYYADNYKCKIRGYDVSTTSVLLGQMNGYDTRECDLNIYENNGIDLSDINFVCMYHVLEHVINPIHTLKMLYDLAEPGTLFHIEVPIEKDRPQPEYGHLFGFHEGDLPQYCQAVGLKLISYNYYYYGQGDVISDRVLAYKPLGAPL